MPVSMNSNAIIFTQQRRLSASLDGLLDVHCPGTADSFEGRFDRSWKKLMKQHRHKFGEKKIGRKTGTSNMSKCSARSAIHIAMCLNIAKGTTDPGVDCFYQ